MNPYSKCIIFLRFYTTTSNNVGASKPPRLRLRKLSNTQCLSINVANTLMSPITEYYENHQLQHKAMCATSPVLRYKHNSLDILSLLCLMPLAKYDKPRTGPQNDKGLKIDSCQYFWADYS